jgi:hypothetical protein
MSDKVSSIALRAKKILDELKFAAILAGSVSPPTSFLDIRCDEGRPAWRVEDCREAPAASIDLAIVFHVIEHVDNPLAIMHRVAEWLSPAGLFVVETPTSSPCDGRRHRGERDGGHIGSVSTRSSCDTTLHVSAFVSMMLLCSSASTT